MILGWCSGHLTPEVADCVRRKGRVLLFHGGGCAPFTQVNDAHLHAAAQRLMVEFENEFSFEERKRLLAEGSNRIPDPNWEDMFTLAQSVWSCIPHAEIGRKGYLQTGPTLPLTGPVKDDDALRYLRKVVQAIAQDEGR